MAPRKKIRVTETQQPENMTKPETGNMKSPLLDSPSPSTKIAKPTTKDHTLSEQDWSLLPEELLCLISKKLEKKLENCFDVIHARSVCHMWRSIFPFPSCLLRTSYSLPSFSMYDSDFEGEHAPSCTLEKFHLFFFRLRAPTRFDGLPFESFVGAINQVKSEDHMERRSPLQCSVKVMIPGFEPTLLNIVDYQILPLGYQFRMVGWHPYSQSFRDVAFLPLDKEGGKEFVVLIGYAHHVFALRSSEMRWMRLEKTSQADCNDIVTFRGKFYVTYISGDIRVIDPYSLTPSPLYPLELASLMPLEDLSSGKDLVPYGNDELFLVESISVRSAEVIDLCNIACRVSRLDEDTGEWVVVTDLGDRLLLIGQHRNSSCSVKELPNGCCVSGNSFLFMTMYATGYVGETYFYKYGVDTGNAEDNLNLWRKSRETLVTFLETKLNSSPMVALRAERFMP